MGVEVLPATADRFDDVARLLAPSRPGTPACWCLSCRVDSHERGVLKSEPHTLLFVGVASAFAAEGFELIGTSGATSASRPGVVMRKYLGGGHEKPHIGECFPYEHRPQHH